MTTPDPLAALMASTAAMMQTAHQATAHHTENRR